MMQTAKDLDDDATTDQLREAVGRPGASHGGVPDLEQVLGDLDTFERTTLHGRYLHRVPQARVEDLLSLDDVEHLVVDAGLRSPFVKLVRDDEFLEPSRYTRRIRIGVDPVEDLIHPANTLREIEDGATLILQGLQRYWPPLHELCRRVEQRFGYAAHANAYLTPPNARGFLEHSDTHGALMLQTHGAKEWVIGDGPARGPGSDRSARLPVTLRAGEILYLSAGTPHAGTTSGAASLHVTIGLAATSWAEVARAALDLVLAEPANEQPLPPGMLVGRGLHTPTVAAYLHDVAKALAAVPPELPVTTLTDAFAAKSPPPPAMRPRLRPALGDLPRS